MTHYLNQICIYVITLIYMRKHQTYTLWLWIITRSFISLQFHSSVVITINYKYKWSKKWKEDKIFRNNRTEKRMQFLLLSPSFSLSIRYLRYNVSVSVFPYIFRLPTLFAAYKQLGLAFAMKSLNSLRIYHFLIHNWQTSNSSTIPSLTFDFFEDPSRHSIR